ncbi:MAG: putative cytochrome [Ilumatobacteraceae bacterium]|nr:putative cytochrome [Ilumatobacteraceae bacterium]MCU1387791.1 putative cytochrome [Ilumatobacteraceae bacterium]
MASIYGPVKDWETDFDHAEPEYNENAPAVWEQLRGTCPVAHTDRYNGTWLPVTHALVTQIAYDTEHFTSRSVIVSPFEQLAPAPIGGAPPITSDPPFHHDARRLLLPAFAPKKIEPWEADVRALCQRLLADLGDADVIDAAAQYAQHIPVNVIALMLGFPVEDADIFFGFVHDVIEGINVELDQRMQAFVRLDEYVNQQVREHVDNPRDDLTTFLLNATIEGEPLTLDHVGGSIVLLLIAGIDTTWSAISSSLLHLATHPEDRRRLVDDPSLIPVAIEEFLRAYAPVTMARMVKADVEIGGCPMKVDDWVLLPFPAANVDPAAFDRADEVIIDRAENRHLAFGLGIHRCLGSNLARLELKVAVEEFLLRYPSFELATDAVTWSVGQIRGPRTVPVRITA